MKNGEIPSEMFFHCFLQTVCRIDANDMALKSYGKSATFGYRKYFLIPYGLNTNSITVKIGFERSFSKKFIEMGQIIYRWIAIKNAKLSHVERFLYFATV